MYTISLLSIIMARLPECDSTSVIVNPTCGWSWTRHVRAGVVGSTTLSTMDSSSGSCTGACSVEPDPRYAIANAEPLVICISPVRRVEPKRPVGEEIYNRTVKIYAQVACDDRVYVDSSQRLFRLDVWWLSPKRGLGRTHRCTSMVHL